MAFGESDREWRRRMREEQRGREEEARERRHREHLEAIERGRQEAEQRHYENQAERARERERREIERDFREGRRHWSLPTVVPAAAAAPKPPEATEHPKSSGIGAGTVIVASLIGLYAVAKVAEGSAPRPARRSSGTPDSRRVPAPPPAVESKAEPTGWTVWDSVALGAAAGVMFWIGMHLARLLI